MRYVLYALAAVVATLAWVNNSTEGHRIKRHWVEAGR
jgi:tryptophan-rich sensory protein